LIERAVTMSNIDIAILEGVRWIERQRKLLALGATTTLRSRHLPHARDDLARAVDIAPVVDGEVRWDWPLYHRLAAVVKNAAAEENVPVEWGSG
jgi:peptidoglycan L-alanyl-D-glutamate endopeptidase CwlK